MDKGVSSMTEKPELAVVEYDGMQMTTVGLVPGGEVTKEGILAHLVSLNFFQAGINWCVGDLLLEGTAAFGEDWMLQAVCDHMGSMSPDTQKQCQWVAQRFPHAERLNCLTWSHHMVVAGIDDDGDRQRLLECCVEPTKDAPGRGPDSPMSITDLRRAVRAAKDDDEDNGEKALAAAMRMVERLAYPERARLLDWMESQGTIWIEQAQLEERAAQDARAADGSGNDIS